MLVKNIEPILLNSITATQYTSLSPSKLRNLEEKGLIESIKIGGRRLWVKQTLDLYIEELRKK